LWITEESAVQSFFAETPLNTGDLFRLKTPSSEFEIAILAEQYYLITNPAAFPNNRFDGRRGFELAVLVLREQHCPPTPSN